MRAADADTALADTGKHGIAIGTVEVGTAFAGIPEDLDSVAVFICPGQLRGQDGEQQQQGNLDSFLHGIDPLKSWATG